MDDSDIFDSVILNILLLKLQRIHFELFYTLLKLLVEGVGLGWHWLRNWV
jgi:hypothetical protein